MVLRQGLNLAGVGAGVGLVGALIVSQRCAGMRLDPITTLHSE